MLQRRTRFCREICVISFLWTSTDHISSPRNQTSLRAHVGRRRLIRLVFESNAVNYCTLTRFTKIIYQKREPRKYYVHNHIFSTCYDLFDFLDVCRPNFLAILSSLTIFYVWIEWFKPSQFMFVTNTKHTFTLILLSIYYFVYNPDDLFKHNMFMITRFFTCVVKKICSIRCFCIGYYFYQCLFVLLRMFISLNIWNFKISLKYRSYVTQRMNIQNYFISFQFSDEFSYETSSNCC